MPSGMEDGDLSDASSEEWSDISDDSSSESDSGTGDIVTHAHASQLLKQNFSQVSQPLLSTVWIPSTLASCLQHIKCSNFNFHKVL